MMNNITPRDWEALSAYLDGQLAPKERQLLEARLQARADLRIALDELRRTRGLLRVRLPLRAPRNFTLTPEMAGIRQRARPGISLFPTMRLASALSTLLFVLVTLGDLLLGGRLSPSTLMVAEQRQAAQPMSAAPAATAMEVPPAAAPEVALQAPAPESAQPTETALAKAGEPVSPTPLSELAKSIPLITENVQTTGQGLGAGGAGGGQDTADQAALSQMAAAATATPLPTPTLTPSATPGPPAEQVANQVAREEVRARLLSERALWRWAELILALVGVGTGLIAFYMHRTGRS